MPLRMPAGNEEITVMGWVRTFRNNQFIALNDGSSNENLQVVLELGQFDESLLKKINDGNFHQGCREAGCFPRKGSAGRAEGQQRWKSWDYAMRKNSRCSPKNIVLNSYGKLPICVSGRIHLDPFSGFGMRLLLPYTSFLMNGGLFTCIHPIITASDAEGAGEMFKVTTLPFDNTAAK